MGRQVDRSDIERLWREAGGEAAGPAPAPAAATFCGLPAADAAGSLVGHDAVVLGLGLGGALRPAAVRAAAPGFAAALPAGRLRAADYGDVPVDEGDMAASLVRAHARLADILAVGAVPVVVGGGPLVTVPVAQVLSGKLRGRLGVVAVTPWAEVAPEPAYAAVSRWARVLELGVVAPENLVLVGVRDWGATAPGRRVLEAAGAHVVGASEVERLGMATVAAEAVAAAAARTEAVHLSIDVAAVAGAAEPGGLSPGGLLLLVETVGECLLAAVDVCVSGDVRAPGGGDGGTAGLAARAAVAALTAVARQRAQAG